MTRKEFELIAATIRAARLDHACTPERVPTINDVARRFADALAGTNASFNRARFLAACGVE